MASAFVKTGEYYYKGLRAFKKKSDEFVKNIEIIQDYMPSVIQRLPQEQFRLNMLSIGSGTGEVDIEIVKIVKEELQQSQDRHQIEIYNRAIEPSEYACDFYKAAVERLNDPRSDFDIRCQTFQEYKERQEGEEPKERSKFDVVHFVHSIYYLDIEEALCHCIENDLRANGSLFCIVEGVDLIYWVLEKQRFPDWHSKQDDLVPEIFETAEKISKIARKRGWKHEVHNQEYPIDVTDVFDVESKEGKLLLDFLTHSEKFRDTADKKMVEETLALIKDCSAITDGKRFGKKKETLIIIYK